jgi:RNA polymerase sigma-70 factor (ECF subfamily)
MTEEARLRQDQRGLVAAARRGDRESMRLLVEQELPWIRGIVAGALGPGDSADDVCQEVFVAAWQAIGTLRRDDGFRPWLYRIAVNAIRSHLRKVRRNPVQALPADVPARHDGAGPERADRAEALRAALARLPAEYRDPLILHYLDGKSCDETAARLGLRPVTARIRLLRGRRQLAAVLRESEVL